MFLEILDDGTDVKRTLAILTRNNAGAVACMNLLKIAGLRKHFSAIWSMYPGVPSGVYNEDVHNDSCLAKRKRFHCQLAVS